MIVLVAAAVLALSPAPGPDARTAPLDQVFPFWTDYQALEADERDAFTLTYQLAAPLRGDGAEFGFWVETAPGEYAALDISAPVTPPDRSAFAQGLSLYTNAPRGAVRVEMRLTLPGAPRAEYHRSDLEAALAQAGNAMRSAMGLRSLFMPRLDTVRFVFDGPAPDAEVITVDGARLPIEDVYESQVLVTPRDRDMRDLEAVRFGRPPLFAVLETRG